MSMREKLKHAFAVDPPGPAEPTPEQAEAAEWICKQIARRHLTLPGLIGLEMARPLNFMASQMMHVFEPAIWAIARQRTHEGYKHFAEFLEQRGAMEYMARRIEELEAQMETQASVRGPRPKRDEEEHDDDRS